MGIQELTDAERKALIDKRGRRLFEIVEVGASDDALSRAYDFVGVFFVLLNLTVSIMLTFSGMEERHGKLLETIEAVTIAYFAIDYFLRILAAKYRYPDRTTGKAILKYMTSIGGVIDLVSFLPYCMPFFFPAGAVAFRMFRVIRIFRLFRINAYYDSLNVITEVLSARRQQLVSSVFIIVILMLASSLAMYSLENEAQPEVFNNAFSGIWWAVSTLLTIGYGDIYPITYAGKLFSTVITFLGVGMVAIPTGIISAGFVEQYASVKHRAEYAEEKEIQFIKLRLSQKDNWTGKRIAELELPHGVIVAAIRRAKETIIPRGDVILMADDTVVLGAEPFQDDQHIEMKEITLGPHNAWNGEKIRDIDISRQTMIVMVRRGNTVLIPNGDLQLREKDQLIMYSKKNHLIGMNEFEV
ncbi:MAG: ion transporter [Lachnospiraceae bacterium]|nr:ion transporter [Lachnospiraceae bacterium]